MTTVRVGSIKRERERLVKAIRMLTIVNDMKKTNTGFCILSFYNNILPMSLRAWSCYGLRSELTFTYLDDFGSNHKSYSLYR